MHLGAAHVACALTDVSWPARLEWLGVSGSRSVLLDAAHNPAGADALARYLSMTGMAPLPIVMAVMKDKDVASMLRALAPVASRFLATEVDTERSLRARELAAEMGRHAPAVPAQIGGTPAEALDHALSQASSAVVAGSIFLVGPMRARLVAAGAVPGHDAP